MTFPSINSWPEMQVTTIKNNMDAIDHQIDQNKTKIYFTELDTAPSKGTFYPLSDMQLTKDLLDND